MPVEFDKDKFFDKRWEAYLNNSDEKSALIDCLESLVKAHNELEKSIDDIDNITGNILPDVYLDLEGRIYKLEQKVTNVMGTSLRSHNFHYDKTAQLAQNINDLEQKVEQQGREIKNNTDKYFDRLISKNDALVNLEEQVNQMREDIRAFVDVFENEGISDMGIIRSEKYKNLKRHVDGID